MKKGLWLITASVIIIVLTIVLVKINDKQETKKEIPKQEVKVEEPKEEPIKEEVKEQPKEQQTTKAETVTHTSTSYSVAEEQEYAHERVLSYGWSEEDFNSLVNLWNRESGWNPNASNGSCYGIPQSCPYSKMGSNYTDWKVQIDWGLNYIQNRYGTPTNAWNHFLSTNWY